MLCYTDPFESERVFSSCGIKNDFLASVYKPVLFFFFVFRSLKNTAGGCSF